MKDIRQYLHLYVPSRARYFTANSQGEINPHTIGHILVHFDEYKNFQIELRRLSSMTEEEGKHIVELATRFSGRVEYRLNEIYKSGADAVILIAYHRTESEKFGNQEYAENIHIGSDGIWVNNIHRDLQHHTNGFLITQYLIQQGFWIFGSEWFDEGLIIDADTLKQ